METKIFALVFIIFNCYVGHANVVNRDIGCGDEDLVLLDNNICYFFSEDFQLSLTWDGASQYCHLFSDEIVTYNLVVLDNNDLSELDSIHRYMQSKGYNYAYIGLTNANPQNNLTDWRWSDGTSFSLNSPLWSVGNPDVNSTTCGYIENVYDSTIYGSYERAHIGEFSCSYERNFVCKGTF